ncbi:MULTISPECIES: anti-sigma factor domain-containing protein [unclassified Endozoicomonas]|uniref:anti-sigma factor n=1 Tax=unclassified Endozoicomonas TaxID=2644528 RepID=UPI0021471EC3|nr:MULTISPECIES: anti-sigma factor [unclassified Endozoicomonas]
MHDDRLDLSNPDERNQAAADYVLGLLTPDEKAQFEVLMAVSHDVQREVDEWREYLDTLNEALPPVEPPKHIWKNIEQATNNKESFWSSLKFWQGSAFASVALALMVALANFQSVNPANMEYVYVVNNQKKSPGWILNASLGSKKLVMETVQPDSIPEGKACELWLVVDGVEPVSLGMLPESGTKEMTIPKGWAEKLSKAKIIVTLEDQKGAPNGWDMGPVLDKGDWSTRTY